MHPGSMPAGSMPSAGLEPATPALGRRRSTPLSYEGMAAERPRGGIIDFRRPGRSSARLECTVRDREVGGSNPLAPTSPLRSRNAVRQGESALPVSVDTNQLPVAANHLGGCGTPATGGGWKPTNTIGAIHGA